MARGDVMLGNHVCTYLTVELGYKVNSHPLSDTLVESSQFYHPALQNLTFWTDFWTDSETVSLNMNMLKFRVESTYHATN